MWNALRRMGPSVVALILGSALAACGTEAGDATPRGPTDPYPSTGETKEFSLTVEEGSWEVGPGAVYNAVMYNGTIPGPAIEVNAGDRVVVHVTNKTAKARSVHTHISTFDTENDGVHGSLTEPGKTRTYTWEASYAGSFPYHDHGDEAEGVARGLFGAVIVHAPDEPPAKEHVVLLADFVTSDYASLPGVADPVTGKFPEEGTYRGGHQYMHTINGKAYEDAIPPFKGTVGELQRWRIVSIGREFHTWHIHGHRWVDTDGALTDNILLGPGMYSTFDFMEDAPGTWPVHCHVPDHMEGGMFAMYEVVE